MQYIKIVEVTILIKNLIKPVNILKILFFRTNPNKKINCSHVDTTVPKGIDKICILHIKRKNMLNNVLTIKNKIDI